MLCELCLQAYGALTMPKCSCDVTGIHEEWAKDLALVRRLSETGRLLESPSASVDLKPCNKHCSHNASVLRPLLQKVSEEAEWALFSLPAIQKELLIGIS